MIGIRFVKPITVSTLLPVMKVSVDPDWFLPALKASMSISASLQIDFCQSLMGACCTS
jgi:hypothetical protein